ncbi:class I SAM-dependent methyltransferase [Pseudonocardia pini]|uniref:class I SAM-dependent methyltransferase n=1 Tax=Pseudonocardia pini TaxID=2758030 RepID=UPI0015F04B0D|nr:class I SAM-dependent methyltransferase [Pseudonocardia pini]
MTVTPPKQFAHAVLPSATLDERAREDAVRTLRRTVLDRLVPGVADAWRDRVEPALPDPAATRAEIRSAMLADPFVQHTFSLRRIVQEQVWDTTAQIVGRQAEDLAERASSMPARAGGTLQLDPDLPIPPYLKTLDVHGMPTGYWDEVTDGHDVAAGAMYDRGVYLYALGRSGPLGDSRGRSVAFDFFAERLPDFRPARILDLGCSVGHSLLPYAELYPEAEIWGIDVAPGVLRYAHARAESLGRRVHFAQRDAEDTRFAAGSFDLVVSHILLHETSAASLPRIFAECHRLLAPGGYMVHAELPQYADQDLFTQFMIDYDTFYNNEPFWGAMHDTDLDRLAVEAGFAPEDVSVAFVASGRTEGTDRTGRSQPGRSPGQLQLTVARKAVAR